MCSTVLDKQPVDLSIYTPQKMFLLAFSFANFEIPRGSTGKTNISTPQFFSPPVQIAWWAHMHRFLSVCLYWTKNRRK